MQKKLKKFKFFFIFLIFTGYTAFFCPAHEFEIDYCGIFSEDLDMNMAKLTSDLYYTQLSEIQGFSVTDRRAEFTFNEYDNLDKTVFTPQKKTFFAEINKKNDSDKWITVFHIVYESSEVTRIKEYDSFYKILMEPKDNLKTTLAKCIAAESLKAMPGFDIKMLHRVAKRIEEFPTIEKLSPDEIVDTLSHPSKISAMQKRFFREAHSVDPDNCQYYSDQLQKLHEKPSARAAKRRGTQRAEDSKYTAYEGGPP